MSLDICMYVGIYLYMSVQTNHKARNPPSKNHLQVVVEVYALVHFAD